MHGPGIAWTDAATDADVDKAFAAARVAHQPVFVYWGARWCPPCNQVKATLFNRQDFIERSRAFVAVYVDGDSPGAQKLGARFHVSGYPTMLLFNAHGVEVTRLPGEVDPARYTQLLTLGMNAERPVKAVLADALAGGRGLGANDWRMLAFYAWDSDEQQLVPKADVPRLLARLAAACPAEHAEASIRLRLQSLTAADVKAPPQRDPASLATLLEVLANRSDTRAHTDVLTGSAAEITRAVSAARTPERARLLDAFNLALKRLEADASLSRADRLSALIAQVDLATIDRVDGIDLASAASGAAAPLRSPPAASSARAAPALPAGLLADIRAQVERDDREISDGYERQAVITGAAWLLARAGLDAESDALLEANLAKSHSPYYLMSALAANAKRRGDRAAALRWTREAFEKSDGPATRLQWGASYVNALIELAPADAPAIEQATARLWSEAATRPDAFYERSARSLQRVGTALQRWNRRGAHRESLQRLQRRLDALCATVGAADGQRARCEALLQPTTKPAA